MYIKILKSIYRGLTEGFLNVKIFTIYSDDKEVYKWLCYEKIKTIKLPLFSKSKIKIRCNI